MIVPSIDLMDGRAVQLIGGREKVLDAGDPRPLAELFGRVGEVAVVDLDAALGQGSNEDVIRDLVRIAPCRVGGGIRSVEAALKWLDVGARSVVLGTAATPEVLAQLPRERVIAALDAEYGVVVVEGWRKGTGQTITDRMEALRHLVGGFLVTFVEREGRLGGVDMGMVHPLLEAAHSTPVTIAGGVTVAEDVAKLDAAGADAQIGMALYTERLGLAEAFAAPLTSDRADGLWPTVVVDEHGIALGLAWSSLESLREALATGRGVYHSRKRGTWVKGETSGDRQDLLRVSADCDRDALRFVVRQHGQGFCHLGTRSCWGDDANLSAIARLLESRAVDAPPGSYTRRLLDDATLLRSKLVEEAKELADAASAAEVAHEAADLLYFTLVTMARGGAGLPQVEAELLRRNLRVTRRRGDAKPAEPELSE